MTDETLFGDDVTPAGPSLADLSAGQRLTVRQRRDVSAGIHPLMGGPLHERADRTAKAADPKNLPFTCGTCVNRDSHEYPSCKIGPRSRGAATDVRAWWPACPSYQVRP